jgi:hypothetical protein
MKNIKLSRAKHNYAVEQYDSKGNWIATYVSPTIAYAMTGISYSSIVNTLTRKIPSAGGYQWKKVK